MEQAPLSKEHNSASPELVPGFLDRLVYYCLLATIVLTAIPYGTVQPWWISIVECLVFVIAMFAVVDISIRRNLRIDLPLIAPLLALVLFALIQSVPLFPASGPLRHFASISADPFSTRLFAVELIALILVALLLSHYVTTKGRLQKLIYVLIGIGMASALFGMVRQHFQQTPGFFLPALPTGGRSYAQFINRNHFAVLLEMTLGLTLGLIVGEWGRHRRVLVLLAIAVLFWIAIIFSNSRGGIVASLCQLLFFAVVLDPVRHLTPDVGDTRWTRLRSLAGGFIVRTFLVIALIGFLIYGVGWIGGEPVVSNFQLAATDFSRQEMEDNVNTSRKEIWSSTWRMFKAHPLAGTGFGAYWIAITRYHRASGEITPQQAHNDYLELMASGGIIGCALVAWFLVVFAKRVRWRMRSADPYFRAVCLGALAGIFGVAIHSFVDFGLHITINALVLFVLMVIALQGARLAPSDAGSASAS